MADLDYTTLQQGDIVLVTVERSFGGFPEGVHKGIVVDLEQDGRAIAFTDVELLKRAKKLGVWQFLSRDSFDNCEIEVIEKGFIF